MDNDINSRKNKHLNFKERTIKRLECSEFISYAVEKIKNNSLSPDACFDEALRKNTFDHSEMVCTKTLYNYIDLGLLDVKNIDLLYKLRRNIKPTMVRNIRFKY